MGEFFSNVARYPKYLISIIVGGLVALLEPLFTVTQDVVLDALRMNQFSFNTVADDASTGAVFGGSNILTVSNDNSQYYVPNYNVDAIEAIDVNDGYLGFLSGMDDQTLSVTGLPVDLANPVLIDK